MKTIRNIAVVTGLCLACASSASAQSQPSGQAQTGGPSFLDNKAFVNVNIGGQTQARTVDTSFTVPNVYGETAALAATATIDGGPLFDISFGYRFRPSFGASIGFSRYNKDGSVFGPAAVTITPRPAAHSENNIYVLFVYFVPISDKMELALSAGPSVTKVKQELITGFTIPPGTQSVLSDIGGQSGTGAGVNVGADLAVAVYNYVAVGGFVRYNGGKVDLPAAPDLKFGGFQAGGGLRLKF